MASREESNRKKTENIKKIAINKINSMSDKQINDRVVGMGEAKFSIEATVKMVLGDFALFIRSIEHFKNEEYEDVKRAAIDAVLPIFGQKVLEEEKKDLSKLGIAEKRQILIDNVNKQSFNLCQDNAGKKGEVYNQENPIEIYESSEFDDYYVKTGGTIKQIEGNGEVAMKDPHLYDREEKFVSEFMNNGELVVVKNNFEFEGPRTCTIRFVTCKAAMKIPKFKKPEKYVYLFDAQHVSKEYKFLLLSQSLSFLEKEALKICFRKNNRQYKLDRKVLQDIINGKTKKKAPEAITLIRSSKRK